MGGPQTLALNKDGRPAGNLVWNQTIFDSLTREMTGEMAREIDRGGYYSGPKTRAWIKDRSGGIIPE